MSQPLPGVLLDGELPLVVLRAAALDGDLYAIGEGYRPIDLPADPSARAASLAGIAVRERILAGPTAAWVWGARPDPGHPYLVVVPPGAAVGHALPGVEGGVRVREQQLRARDVMRLAGVPVTTPLRTAIDLLRATGPDWERQVVAALLQVAGLPVDVVIADLATRRRLAGASTAAARAQVLVTR
jgi:hypothetical protein